jgi:lysophospholipase L1-like esterase
MADYRSLIQTLQAHGAQIVYVAPPIYLPLYGGRTEFQRSLLSMQAQLPPGPLINFTDPEYTAFNSDPKNFADGLHLSPDGVIEMSKILSEKLHLLFGTS